MKTYSYSSRNALILMTTCLLFLITYPASQAMSAEAARLIVRRDPGLGNYVIAHLRVDGVLVATIGYGRTYEGLLPPGRHVLSLLATPNPKWPTPSAMILDVRSGQTYSFTA